MTIKGVHRLVATEQESNVGNEKYAREKQSQAIDKQKELVDRDYLKAMEQAKHDQDARETKSDWTCGFAIFLGPLIGTAIGNAIGDGAADDDVKASHAAKKEVGELDLKTSRADDAMDDAKKALDETRDSGKQLGKIRREISDNDWTGIS